MNRAMCLCSPFSTLEGLLKPERLLDVIKNHVFFMNKDKERPIKITENGKTKVDFIKEAYQIMKNNK